MMYLVIVPHYWGRGSSIAEAEKNARKEGGLGRKKVERKCFSYDPEKTRQAYIDEFGRLCWEGERPQEINL